VIISLSALARRALRPAGVLAVGLCLVGCPDRPEPPPPAPDPAAPPDPPPPIPDPPESPPPPTPEQVPVPQDYEDEAAKEIDGENYRQALDEIAGELDDDTASPAP